MNQRQPRLYDPKYLAWLRLRHCLACGRGPKSDAAHIRAGCLLIGKRETGMAEKPDDKWALPLCRKCHETQHRVGELFFWTNICHRDPFLEAITLYQEFGGDGGKPRALRKIKPRKPKESRTTIKSRGFDKGKRKIQSRPFQRRKSNGQMG